MKNKTYVHVSEETVEALALEVLTEGLTGYEPVMRKLANAKPGSQRYRDLLCDLSVHAVNIKLKAQEAESVIDEYLESHPDGDDD